MPMATCTVTGTPRRAAAATRLSAAVPRRRTRAGVADRLSDPYARRSPGLIAAFSSVPVSSAMPKLAGPETSSTSSDVAPGQGDLEVVDDPGAVHRDRRDESALHQIDEHGREARLDHVRRRGPDSMPPFDGARRPHRAD